MRRLLGLYVMIAIAVFGCSKPEPKISRAELNRWIVEPGVGAGPLKLGLSKEETIELLGEPDIDDRGQLVYYAYGLELMVTSSEGLSLILAHDEGVKLRWSEFQVFPGTTGDGIGIGSSKAEVIQALGVEGDRSGVNGSTLSYLKQGIVLHLDADGNVRSYAIVVKR